MERNEPRDVRQGANWTGIFAGVLAGLAVYLVLSVLGLSIGVSALGTGGVESAGGLAMGAAIYVLITVAIAAFLTGGTAARAAGFVTPAQGRLNGLLAGMLLLVLTTMWSFNVLSSTVGSALGLAGSAVSGAATAAGAAGAAGATAANQNGGAQGVATSLGLGSEYRALANGFDRQEVNQIIAEASPELNEKQVGAATGVVQGVLRRAGNKVRGSLSNPSNIGEVVQQQFKEVQSELSGASFTQRLRARGLSDPQAREVTRSVNTRVQELQQQAQEAQQKAEQAAKAAARATATAGWIWLAGAGLLLGLATWAGGLGGDRWAKVAPGGDIPMAAAPVATRQPVVETKVVDSEVVGGIPIVKDKTPETRTPDARTPNNPKR